MLPDVLEPGLPVAWTVIREEAETDVDTGVITVRGSTQLVPAQVSRELLGLDVGMVEIFADPWPGIPIIVPRNQLQLMEE